MDAVYEKAVAKKRALELEIAEIDVFLRLYERYATETNQKQTEPVLNTAIASSRAKRKARPSELVSIVERLIRSHSSPMQRGEIVDALAHSDIELESQDPARYLGTLLWRNSDRFINVPGEGYTLTDLLTPLQHRKIAETKADSPELSEERMAEIKAIAELAAGQTSESESHRISEYEKLIGALPQDADGRLLAVARETLGRKLDELEKRMLREEFRRLI
ncbi:hypothetical protein [Rhizobium leguminosarum]|uniref:hypothetical protein n=1 Tax=Rhizobium leguminosarum TaxID=384 RepID=UPI003F9A81BF